MSRCILQNLQLRLTTLKSLLEEQSILSKQGGIFTGAAEQGSPGSPGAPLFQDMHCHFQKHKAKAMMTNGSKVTICYNLALFVPWQ